MTTLDTADAVKVCSVPDCDREPVGRGWCRRHWKRWRKYGDPTAGGPARCYDVSERLFSNIEKTDTCWIYTGQINNKGYGLVTQNGTKRGAHVVSYELLVGPVPPGLELDHLCRNPPCVNPAHLEPVTHAENQRRAGEAQTHCRPAGHPYTPENTYRGPNGRRKCRECARIRDRARSPHRKAAA